MRLVNQIHIKPSNGLFSECERLCFASKNLYNQALYRIKEQYKTDKTYLNYPALSKQMSGENQVDYRALPSKVAQQTLMLLDKSYKSYFLALEAYNKSPEKFNAQPKLPNFKHKTKGRFVATFTEQAISSKALKNGFLKLSGSSINISTDFNSTFAWQQSCHLVNKGQKKKFLDIIG